MAKVDDIVERIKNRKKLITTGEEISVEQEQNSNSKVFKISIFIFSIFSLILGFLIYAKKDENGKFLKETFNIEVNFSIINKKAQKILDKFLVFEYDFMKNKNDQFVGLSDSYIGLGNNEYTNSSLNVYAIENGVVTGVNHNSIVIEHDNGVIAQYNKISEIFVYKFDRVKEYQIIGIMNEKIEMNFYYDGVKIDYEEIYS